MVTGWLTEPPAQFEDQGPPLMLGVTEILHVDASLRVPARVTGPPAPEIEPSVGSKEEIVRSGPASTVDVVFTLTRPTRFEAVTLNL